ncbi:MAG: HNH endonuclease [Clostridium sp.]|uniref:HNH endonuclease n=1 Tax=Clostridium sp. TaxID=1506 RepID=UPI003F3A236F
MRYCKICGATNNIQSHHIVTRKQQPALIKCKLNQVDLCINCHTSGPNAVHNGGFKELKKLKLEKQREYFEVFNEEGYAKEIIKEILGINQKDVDKLLKTIPMINGKYEKEEIIRACMGGKLLIDTLEYQR